MKRIIFIVISAVLLFALLFFAWLYTKSNQRLTVGDCGTYRLQDWSDLFSTERIVAQECLMQAFSKCVVAHATMRSSDWEGGSHQTIFTIQKNSSGCEVLVEHSSRAFYLPNGGSSGRETCKQIHRSWDGSAQASECTRNTIE